MNSDMNIPDLLRALRDETATLVRQEIALARTELSEKFSRIARNLAYLVIGVTISLAALMLTFLGLSVLVGEWFAARGHNPWSSAFLGLMILGLIVGSVSAVVVTKALKTLSDSSIKPDRTVRSLQEDKQWAQEKLS